MPIDLQSVKRSRRRLKHNLMQHLSLLLRFFFCFTFIQCLLCIEVELNTSEQLCFPLMGNFTLFSFLWLASKLTEKQHNRQSRLLIEKQQALLIDHNLINSTKVNSNFIHLVPSCLAFAHTNTYPTSPQTAAWLISLVLLRTHLQSTLLWPGEKRTIV